MAYNVSFLADTHTIGDVVTNVNTASDGFLGGIFVLVFFLVTFFVAKSGYETVVSFVASGLITTVLSGLLFFGGFIAWWIAIIPLILFLIALVTHFFR